MTLSMIFKVKHLTALALLSSLASCSGGDGGTVDLAFGDLNLSWQAPTEREDGTPIVDPSTEIAGFRVYYGTASGDYQRQVEVDDSAATQAQVFTIPTGIYYVVVTAIDMDGRESLYLSPEFEVKV